MVSKQGDRIVQTVLFIDDEKNVVKSLRRMVRAQGIQCETEGAYNANEALGILDKQSIDLVVSDIRMPGMDGVELLTRLRATPRFQHLPVIMLTAETDLSVRNVALSMGAMDYLSKPVDPNELVARLRNALRLKSYQDELIDRQRRLEEQLEQAQRLELAGLVAVQAVHDLKNTLTGILGSAEVMMARDTGDTPVRNGLDRIIASAKYASEITRHILDAARADSSRGPGAPIDLRAVVDDCIQMVSSGIPPDVRIHWSPPEMPTLVRASRIEVMQVVMNLLTNSVQALHDRGTIDVSIHPEGEGGVVGLTISDDGPGMDEATASRAFDPFVTTKSADGGTGLGLATVKRIIERNGGAIDLSAGPNRGATFKVQFPGPSQQAETIGDPALDRA